MIIGTVMAAVLWVIYVVYEFFTLNAWETLKPSGLLFTLVFLGVCGITTGAIVQLIQGTL